MNRTLSKEKKYELAMLAFTHRYIKTVNIGDEEAVVLQPENKLNLTRLYGTNKFAFIPLKDYVSKNTAKELASGRFDFQLLNPENINDLTATTNGKSFRQDYFKQSEELEYQTGNIFESRIKAFCSQVLVMFTSKAENDLFKASTKNLSDMCQAEILDKKFVNEFVKELFPERSWTVDVAKENSQKENKGISSQEEIIA